jgi:hypothetical protein
MITKLLSEGLACLPEPFSPASRPCAQLPAAWAPAVAVVATVRFEANAVPTARPHQVGRTALGQKSTLAPPSPRRARNRSTEDWVFWDSHVDFGPSAPSLPLRIFIHLTTCRLWRLLPRGPSIVPTRPQGGDLCKIVDMYFPEHPLRNFMENS